MTNNVLSETRGFMVDADITSVTGDVSVNATNDAILDARNKMQVLGDSAVSVVLAYNQVGYESSDIVTQTLDALLGGDYSSAQYTTAMAVQNISQYDRVLVTDEHDAGGVAGRNYLYVGTAGELDFGEIDYATDTDWVDLTGTTQHETSTTEQSVLLRMIWSPSRQNTVLVVRLTKSIFMVVQQVQQTYRR